MVTTTTPNPDPDDRRRAKLELSSRYGKYADTDALAEGTVERQLYPEPAGHPPLIRTADELARECAKHSGQLIRVYETFTDWGDEHTIDRAYIEFADGTRIEVMHT